MKQNETCISGIDFTDWFKVGGDIDDFIFYCEIFNVSEK